MSNKAEALREAKHGFIMAHEFIPDDDQRRHTDFYICGNRKAAETLMRCIRKPNEMVNAPR